MDEKTAYEWAAECLKPIEGVVEPHKLQQAADKVAAAILAAAKEAASTPPEIQRLQFNLSAIEARWREASRNTCFRSHFRRTMEECADELRDLLNGIDDSVLEAEIDKAFAGGEL